MEEVVNKLNEGNFIGATRNDMGKKNLLQWCVNRIENLERNINIMVNKYKKLFEDLQERMKKTIDNIDLNMEKIMVLD